MVYTPAMILGLGVDVVEVSRIGAMIRRHGKAFLRRVFTSREAAWCAKRARPEAHYAARFAAKEAMLKALGTGWAKGVAFTQVELRRGRDGAPSIELTGAARVRARRIGVRRVHVSMSHDAGVAIAMVIAEGAAR